MKQIRNIRTWLWSQASLYLAAEAPNLSRRTSLPLSGTVRIVCRIRYDSAETCIPSILYILPLSCSSWQCLPSGRFTPTLSERCFSRFRNHVTMSPFMLSQSDCSTWYMNFNVCKYGTLVNRVARDEKFHIRRLLNLSLASEMGILTLVSAFLVERV